MPAESPGIAGSLGTGSPVPLKPRLSPLEKTAFRKGRGKKAVRGRPSQSAVLTRWGGIPQNTDAPPNGATSGTNLRHQAIENRMNPADHLRYLLALAIAKRIRTSPEEAEKALERIRSNIGSLVERGMHTRGDAEWLALLDHKTPVEIAGILEDKNHEGQRLRSNLRGHGVITDEERLQIIQNANGL